MDVNISLRNGLKLGVLAWLCGMACRTGPTATVRVRQDVAAALREAVEHHEQVLVLYSAPWCSACRALQQSFAQPKVAAALAKWMVVQIDVDEALGVQADVPLPLQPQHVGLKAVPQLMCFPCAPSWDVGSVLQGYVGQQRLLAWLQSACVPQRACSPAGMPKDSG